MTLGEFKTQIAEYKRAMRPRALLLTDSRIWVAITNVIFADAVLSIFFLVINTTRR